MCDAVSHNFVGASFLSHPTLAYLTALAPFGWSAHLSKNRLPQNGKWYTQFKRMVAYDLVKWISKPLKQTATKSERWAATKGQTKQQISATVKIILKEAVDTLNEKFVFRIGLNLCSNRFAFLRWIGRHCYYSLFLNNTVWVRLVRRNLNSQIAFDRATLPTFISKNHFKESFLWSQFLVEKYKSSSFEREWHFFVQVHVFLSSHQFKLWISNLAPHASKKKY